LKEEYDFYLNEVATHSQLPENDQVKNFTREATHEKKQNVNRE